MRLTLTNQNSVSSVYMNNPTGKEVIDYITANYEAYGVTDGQLYCTQQEFEEIEEYMYQTPPSIEINFVEKLTKWYADITILLKIEL